MKPPKVSIVIPTFNRLSFLKKAVNSVLKQTFTDYEIIVSDNCSTDNTKKWVIQKSQKYSQLKYYRNSKNLGMVGNWNAGVKRANGEYITILMDDDYWHKDFLKNTVIILDKNLDVGIVCVHVIPTYVNNYTGDKIYTRDFYRLYNNDIKLSGKQCISQYITDKWLVGLPSAILTRRKYFKELGYFDQIGLDPEMWLRICSKYDFYYLDQTLCYWRIHNKPSFTNNNNGTLNGIKSKIYIVKKIFSYDMWHNNKNKSKLYAKFKLSLFYKLKRLLWKQKLTFFFIYIRQFGILQFIYNISRYNANKIYDIFKK